MIKITPMFIKITFKEPKKALIELKIMHLKHIFIIDLYLYFFDITKVAGFW